MKQQILVLLAAAGVLASAVGCTHEVLHNGMYKNPSPSRDDYAVVYEDLIFLHIKAPENIPGASAYWEWAGNYSINSDDGLITFDMDRETASRWNFSYNFLRRSGKIIINDLGAETGIEMRYVSPKLRPGSSNAPRPVSTSGVNPEYKSFDTP